MRWLLCETCETVSELPGLLPDDSPHAGHRGVVVEGDEDTLSAVVAKHFDLARRINGHGPYSLPGEPGTPEGWPT
jgi:hypothetical protein